MSTTITLEETRIEDTALSAAEMRQGIEKEWRDGAWRPAEDPSYLDLANREARQAAEMLILSANEAEQTEAPS